MLEPFDLVFSYKASRDYVHGTDIFNSLIRKFDEPPRKFDVAFHGVSKSNLSFSESRPENEGDLKVTVKVLLKDSKIRLFGFENKSPLLGRYDYDEDSIIKRAELNLEDDNICINECKPNSFIENAVALKKHLVQEKFHSEDGKWYFTRIQLSSPIKVKGEYKKLEIKYQSNFNFKLVKSAVIIDDVLFGYIYFSLLRGEK